MNCSVFLIFCFLLLMKNGLLEVKVNKNEIISVVTSYAIQYNGSMGSALSNMSLPLVSPWYWIQVIVSSCLADQVII